MDQDIRPPISSTSPETMEVKAGNSSETASLSTILSYPVYWPAKEIVSFLKCISDELDIFTRGGSSTKRYKHLEQVLQKNAGKIFTQNWKTLLTPEVENYARNPKIRITGYNGDFVKDLLRFIRNTGSHYLNLDPAMQDELGYYPHEFIAYYIRIFPNLIPILYSSVLKTGILEESAQLHEFYLENTELSYNLDDFDGFANALVNGIKDHIQIGGLRKRYSVKTEEKSCNVLILRLPDGILPIVFTHANILIQISDGFITVHHALWNLQDSQVLLQLRVKSDHSMTIILGRNEVLTSSDWRIPTSTSQVIVFSGLNNSSLYDNAILNAFDNAKTDLAEVPLKWEELGPDYQTTLLHRNVMFQGCKVTLGDIFTWVENPETIEKLKTGTLNGEFLQSLIEDSKPVILYPSVPKIIPYYIDRSICPSKFVPFEILTDNVHDIFVISSTEEELSNLFKKFIHKKLQTISSSSAITGGTLKPSHIILLEDDAHLEVLENKTKLPVHLLKFHGGFLEWMKSWGSSHLIRRHVQSITISEEEFVSFIQRKAVQNQPIIIGDSPGMGKTTILFNSANELIKSNPLKIVKFYSMTEFVSKVDKRVGNFEASLEEIKDSIVAILCQQSKAHPFYNQLMSSFIKPEESESSSSQKIMVELMLDGLDEVDSSQWKLAVKIMFLIYKSFKNVRMWITTRLQHLKFLEWTFSSTISYYLTKLERNDQVRLLTRYWSQDMNSDEKELHHVNLEKLANYCLNNSPKDYMDIAGIPLQCRLLAEVHEFKVKSLLEQEASLEESDFESLKIHSILDLYDKVIETKLHIYFEKQCGTQICIKTLRITKREQETMNVGHEKKALELLMPRWLESFLNNYFFSDKLSLEELLAYGIVECIRKMAGEPEVDDDDGNQNAFSFLHRTIAEYFIAHFMVHLLYWKGPSSDEFLLKTGDFLVQEILKLEDYRLPRDPDNYPRMPQPPKIFVHGAVIIKFFNAMLARRKEDTISSQIYSAIFKSLLKLENWADHLADLLYLLVHTDKFEIFHIIKQSLEQEEGGQHVLGESKPLEMFIKGCSKNKLGDLVCSAVRKRNLNFIKSVCNLVENGGIAVNQLDYQRDIYSWGKIATRKSSPLEPLRLTLENTLNYKLVYYLVVEKGFTYSPGREDFWGFGVLHLCIHQISEDYFILEAGEPCLEEGLNIIKFFVDQNRNVLEEESIWFECLRTRDHEEPPLYEARENALLTPLVYASAIGAPLRLIHALINLGANVNARVNVDNKTLLHFIGYRQPHTKIGSKYKYTPQDLNNVATWAFTHGYNPELLDIAVFKPPLNPDLRKLKVYKRTFLHNVVSSYHDLLPETIELFKRYNVDFNADNGVGSSVLDIAIQNQAPPQTIQVLLNAGCKLEISALHTAIEYCNFPAVKYFIEVVGLKVNGKCGKGCTALHYAMTASSMNPSRAEIIKYLVSKGANINALNRVGTPPFMTPFRKRRWKRSTKSIEDFYILKLLVEKGAKLRKNMCNEIIFRVFMVESDYINKSEVNTLISLLQFVTDKGGNIRYRFKDGKTFLHVACKWEVFEVVKWLVEGCGLDVNAKDKKGKLPIGYIDFKENDYGSASKLKKTIASYLIQKGCICNIILKDEPPSRRVAEDFLA